SGSALRNRVRIGTTRCAGGPCGACAACTWATTAPPAASGCGGWRRMRARSATHRRGRGHDAPRACAGRRVPARHGPTVSQSRARALGPGLGATMSTADTLRPPLAALRAAARQLIRDGYKVLPTNGKAPWDAAAGTGRVGWNAFQLTLESIGREIVPPITGLGVRLGEPSGDLVDVDLDSPEAQ